MVYLAQIAVSTLFISFQSYRAEETILSLKILAYCRRLRIKNFTVKYEGG
jgi:hypothetical protein